MNATQATPSATSIQSLASTLERIVLTGFMGSGKSSVGRLLADSLGWDFLDLDSHIEARAGASIAELFRTGGEKAFRRLESSALANALARQRTVIALGGGTPEELRNQLQLEQTPGTLVVFLEAPFPVLFDRCMLQALAAPTAAGDRLPRPLLASPEQAQARFESRRPIYRRIAKFTLAVDNRTPAEAVDALQALLAQ